jgi:sporulation protein YlmC with PRC-barrel domain
MVVMMREVCVRPLDLLLRKAHDSRHSSSRVRAVAAAGPLAYCVRDRTSAAEFSTLDEYDDGRSFAPYRGMPLRPLSSIPECEAGRALDVRGWSVVSRDGWHLGTVAELIVDLELGAPVYINIEPIDTGRSKVDECWIRVPYRHTSLDDEARRIVLSDMATLGLGTASIDFASGRVAAD